MPEAHAHPVSATPPPVPDPVRTLSVKEQVAMAGKSIDPDAPPISEKPDFFVALDKAGNPGGTVLADPPTDAPYIQVMLTDAATKGPADVLVTKSGAPMTTHMNPEHTFADAGMQERNPVPGVAEPKSSPKAPPKAEPKK